MGVLWGCNYVNKQPLHSIDSGLIVCVYIDFKACSKYQDLHSSMWNLVLGSEGK